jgi:hypothetical protein
MVFIIDPEPEGKGFNIPAAFKTIKKFDVVKDLSG